MFLEGNNMFLDWFTLAGFFVVFALVGLLLYFCKTNGCGT